MKIYRTGDFHHKNSQGMDLVEGVYPWKGETDGIIICNEINEEIIQNPAYSRVIIGPGVDFEKGNTYFRQYTGDKKIVFNCLSPWNKRLIERDGKNERVQYECIPFPVNTEKFKPALQKKRRFFIYFKILHSNVLNVLLTYLSQNKIFKNEHRIFIYGNYDEEDYLNYIQEAEFGIWVGRHESQGFALEEAMSCGCPLFVYDVKSMKDECKDDEIYPWGHLQGDYDATAASYFDETCGIVVKEAEDIPKQFDVFYNRLSLYRPREYVLNHLTARHFNEKVQSLFPNNKPLRIENAQKLTPSLLNSAHVVGVLNEKRCKMKNLVLITSVIHTSSNPLSYTPCRSVFSPQERFTQTKKTFQTVRESIPDSKILLVECSVLTEEEDTYFRTHCDYFINLINEPNMLCWTTALSKSLGEGSMTIKALEYVKQQGLIFDNLFKITGRYFLNEFFKYEKFNNKMICFRHTIGNESVNTSLFKLPYDKAFNLGSFFEEKMDEMKNCVQYEVLFLQFIKKYRKEELLEIDKLGFTSIISECGSVVDYY